MKTPRLVGLMTIAALAICLLVYTFTGSIKWAIGVGGLCYAVDLTFIPWIKQKILEIERG